MLSPGMKLMRHVWDHQGYQMGHSWDRLNDALQSALTLAISCGFQFFPDDFKLLDSRSRDGGFRFGYWGGTGPGGAIGEGFYTVACAARGRNRSHGVNRSACIAYERWRGRKPFIVRLDPRRAHGVRRVAIGTSFYWYGEEHTCTSFAPEGSYLIACSYCDGKVASRKKIMHADIRAYHATLKDQANEKASNADEIRDGYIPIPDVLR